MPYRPHVTFLPGNAITVAAHSDLDRYFSALAGGSLQLVKVLGRQRDREDAAEEASVGLLPSVGVCGASSAGPVICGRKDHIERLISDTEKSRPTNFRPKRHMKSRS